jgi:hypothetical protein
MGIVSSNFFRFAFCVILLLTQIGCMNINNRYIYTNKEGVVTELKSHYQLFGEEYQVTADLTGPLALANDGQTLIELTTGSVIKIENLSNKTELHIRERSGNVIYSYQVEGSPQLFTSSLKEVYMTGFFNHTPIAAEQRTNILYSQFGEKAAIEQLLSSANDDTKSAYIKALSKKDLSVSSQQKVIIVLSGIGNDFTQRISAESFVNYQKPLSEKVWLDLITAFDGMGSDYEHRRVLVFVATELPNSVGVKSAFLASSASIGSDYEKYSLMSELAKQKNVFVISELFTASNDIGSDYEAYRIVNDLGPLINTQLDFTALLRFIKTIGSDYEMRMAISSLSYQHLDQVKTAEIIKLASDYIGSDYELAQTVNYIIKQTPYKLSLNSEISYAIASMSSDNEKIKLYKLM